MHKRAIASFIVAIALCLISQTAQAIIFVQVSGLSDMSLPDWGIGDPDVTSHIDFCVYSTVSNNYDVTVSSAGGYNLVNGAKKIAYTLSWDDSGIGNLGSGGATLSNGVVLSNRSRANAVSPVCLAGPNARLNLAITQAAMNAALSGTYNGTVTVMIAPH